MRDALVDRQLEHLRVDQDQAHVARLGLVQQRQDHRVDAHALARAGGAGHQAVRHLGQVGHHRQADDVLAQAHRQVRGGIVVGLRTEDLCETDHLPLGVGQLQRHRRLAGDRFDDPDADQAERARQILGQVEHLGSFDAGRRLDLVAGDHRPGRGGDHAHLDAEVLQLLLDQPRGHLERLGVHALDPAGYRVEQIDLRQLRVGQFAEQWLLPLLGHALGFRQFGQRLVDDDRQLLLDRLAFDVDDMLALALRGQAQAQVFGAFALLLAPFLEGVDALADRLGKTQPGKPQGKCHAGHQRGDPEHARAGEPQPLHRQRAQRVPQHAPGMTRQQRFEAIQPRRLERGAGGQQQRQAQPERRGMTAASRLAAQVAGQRRQPRPRRHQRQPPHRVAEQEQREVRRPGAHLAGLVAQRLTAARGREARIGSVVGDQCQHRQQPQHRTGQQPQLAPHRHRRCGGVGTGRARSRRAAVGAQRSERKGHARIVAQPGARARIAFSRCAGAA